MHVNSYKKVDIKKGAYMPFGLLVEQFGIHFNRDAAVAAARRYAAACVRMSGNWCFYDPMSKIMHFLHLRREWMQEVAESWKLYKTESVDDGPVRPIDGQAAAPGKTSSTGDGGTELVAEAVAGSAPATNKSKGTAQAKGKAAAKAAAKSLIKGTKAEGKDEENKGCKEKSALAEVSQEALKLKSRYNAAVATGTNLVAMIEAGSPTWKLANNEHNLGALKTDLNALHDGLSDFSKQLIVTDIKTMKEQYGTEHLVVQLREWVSKSGAVDRVVQQGARLTKMHKSSQM